jgi:hypothetical protein
MRALRNVDWAAIAVGVSITKAMVGLKLIPSQ